MRFDDEPSRLRWRCGRIRPRAIFDEGPNMVRHCIGLGPKLKLEEEKEDILFLGS